MEEGRKNGEMAGGIEGEMKGQRVRWRWEGRKGGETDDGRKG